MRRFVTRLIWRFAARKKQCCAPLLRDADLTFRHKADLVFGRNADLAFRRKDETRLRLVSLRDPRRICESRQKYPTIEYTSAILLNAEISGCPYLSSVSVTFEISSAILQTRPSFSDDVVGGRKSFRERLYTPSAFVSHFGGTDFLGEFYFIYLPPTFSFVFLIFLFSQEDTNFFSRARVASKHELAGASQKPEKWMIHRSHFSPLCVSAMMGTSRAFFPVPFRLGRSASVNLP